MALLSMQAVEMSTVIAVFAEVCCLLSFLKAKVVVIGGLVVSFLAFFLKALLRKMALVALCI